jgi:hypothetical protein
MGSGADMDKAAFDGKERVVLKDSQGTWVENPKPKKANDIQVGGDHYKTGKSEHWDIVADHELDYFQGQILRYVMRWNKKDGLKDLKKAEHFIKKYIELVEEGRIKDPTVKTAQDKFQDNMQRVYPKVHGEVTITELPKATLATTI